MNEKEIKFRQDSIERYSEENNDTLLLPKSKLEGIIDCTHLVQSNSIIDKSRGKYSIQKRCNKRKWLVYIASCLVSMLDTSLVLSFGAIFVHILDRFGENRTKTATVQSILISATTISGIFAGILIKRFGIARAIFAGSVLMSGGFIFSFFAKSILFLDVSIGVIAGIGFSFAYVSSTVVARNSFEGNARDLAVSAHNVFVGVGSIMYSYLLKTLAKAYMVNGTFLLVGGLLLNNFVISLLFASNEATISNSMNSEKPDSCADTTKDNAKPGETSKAIKDKRMRDCIYSVMMRMRTLMNFRYTLVLLGVTAVVSANSGYIIVFDDINVWKGFTDDQSALLITLFSAASALGRTMPLICSKVKPGTDLLLLLTFCAIGGCVAQMIILFTTELHFAIIGNMLSGLIHGGMFSTSAVAVAKYSSKELFSVAFGILLTSMGILVLSLGPVYGYIRDSIKSYEGALILTAAIEGAGAIPFIVAKVYNIVQSRRENIDE